jgi:hypothetical protein
MTARSGAAPRPLRVATSGRHHVGWASEDGRTTFEQPEFTTDLVHILRR